MQIPIGTAITAVAGTQLAAAKGGQADKQAALSRQQQINAEAPAGKAAGAAAIDEGAKTDDRGGNGREAYDTFQSQDRPSGEAESDGGDQTPPPPPPHDPPAQHLDLLG